MFFNDSLGFSFDCLGGLSHICRSLITLLITFKLSVTGGVGFQVVLVGVTWFLSLRFVLTWLAFLSRLGAFLCAFVDVFCICFVSVSLWGAALSFL